jgi:hypothetical protein
LGMKFPCILLALILGLGRVLAAEDLAPLLEKMAGAYGGRERLEKIVAYTETAQVTAATSIGNSGPMLRTFARPLKLRVQIGEPEHPKEVRVLDGTNGWRNGKAVTGPSYQAMLLQAVRLDLPFQLLTHQARLVEKESKQYQGKLVRVVELPLENDLSVTSGIDPQTGRILFSSGQIAGGPMGKMSFETAYDDFTTVDGVLFARKEENVASGTKTADTVISGVQFLKEAPAEAFKP